VIAKLAGDHRVIHATRVARVLRLNPLEVLDTDEKQSLILWAAARVCQADDAAREKQRKRGG
jgi:hypothetical protein